MAHLEPNTAWRSRSALNRIVLAAKGYSANAKSQMWETPTISRAGLTRFELVMREPKSRALPLGDSPINLRQRDQQSTAD